MEKISKHKPTLSVMSILSTTDPSILFANNDAEIESNFVSRSTQISASLLDPIKAAMTPENFSENFVEINGRLFMNDSTLKCFLPSDKEEAKRSFDRYYIDKLIWGNDYSAPIFDRLSHGAKVLDVGCGSGAWITNMALNYPASTFVGIDVAPLFPDVIPHNTAFLQCNIVNGLPFPDNCFDFVRQGFLIICMDWQIWKKKVIKELIRITKPGGYIEIMETDGQFLQPGKIARRVNHNQSTLFKNAGINFVSSKNVMTVFNSLNNAVTVAPIEEKPRQFGTRAGKLGEISLKNFTQSFKSLKTILCPHFGFTSDEFEQMTMDLAEELRRCNSSVNNYRVTARKHVKYVE
ncbi:1543_t:CDS:2 [Paraglomus brasilianum]|uniref:1543_t:CDS:1 n=1 Tax=Paraglomus brasilianum TaxID=144538 RepID=A0A9N8ZPW1_9GLOM|nr:1543_t:CDS:2 [Paraglomus brasilianum]